MRVIPLKTVLLLDVLLVLLLRNDLGLYPHLLCSPVEEIQAFGTVHLLLQCLLRPILWGVGAQVWRCTSTLMLGVLVAVDLLERWT